MEHVTRYAKSGDVHIAYQVLGDGPRDLVVVPGAWSHLDLIWDEPSWARYNERLASFARVLLFDKRGTGLSNRVSDTPTLEQRMDDVRAVMDTVGSDHAAIFGVSEGGLMSALFAPPTRANRCARSLRRLRTRDRGLGLPVACVDDGIREYVRASRGALGRGCHVVGVCTESRG